MSTKPYRGFANLIRQRRKELGLTLSEVATRIGWSVPYVSEIERGVKQPPPTEGLKRLSEALQLDMRVVSKEAELSRRSIEMDLEGTGALQRQLAVTLARRFQQGLSDEEAAALLEQLKKLGDGENDGA